MGKDAEADAEAPELVRARSEDAALSSPGSGWGRWEVRASHSTKKASTNGNTCHRDVASAASDTVEKQASANDSVDMLKWTL